MGAHRVEGPSRWPLALAWAVAAVLCAVIVTHGTTADEPARTPPAAPLRLPSGCVPTTTSYPDGSVWHKCADFTATPPPAELPTDDPFSEE